MSDKRALTQEEFEQMQPILIMKKDSGSSGVIVALDNTAFESPGAWGIVIADLVAHVANAYQQDGYSGLAVLEDVRRIVLAELSAPTDKPEACDWEMT